MMMQTVNTRRPESEVQESKLEHMAVVNLAEEEQELERI